MSAEETRYTEYVRNRAAKPAMTSVIISGNSNNWGTSISAVADSLSRVTARDILSRISMMMPTQRTAKAMSALEANSKSSTSA